MTAFWLQRADIGRYSHSCRQRLSTHGGLLVDPMPRHGVSQHQCQTRRACVRGRDM